MHEEIIVFVKTGLVKGQQKTTDKKLKTKSAKKVSFLFRPIKTVS